MPPSLAAYQENARAIYEPQKQAEEIGLRATRDTTKNALESQKGQVATTYQQAIDKLTQSVQDQTGQINQLYSQRLGGNFSGLQGNDLGQMFSRANEQQGYIEQTRANKLNEITTGQTNADINYGAGIAALNPRYQSLETEYAQKNYGNALSDYQSQQAAVAAANARVSRSASSAASNTSISQAGKYKVGQFTSGNKYYTGPNGQTNLFQYAMGANNGDINGAYQEIKSQLKTGSQTDKGAYNGILKLEQQGLPIDQILARLQKSNSYIFD